MEPIAPVGAVVPHEREAEREQRRAEPDAGQMKRRQEWKSAR